MWEEVCFLGPLEAKVALHGLGLEAVIQLFLPRKEDGWGGLVRLVFALV